MREIKFRAWKNDIKVMDYGNGELCGYNKSDSSPTATVNDIINQNHPELEWMQYTGQKDMNGKEIYEGDIVKVKYTDCGEEWEENTEVVWKEKSCQFSPWNFEYDCDGCNCSCSVDSIEVIGNIHENSNLL